MSAEKIAALRKLAEAVAPLDPAYAMTEVERAGISLAQGVLDLITERDQLSAIAERAKPMLDRLARAS